MTERGHGHHDHGDHHGHAHAHAHGPWITRAHKDWKTWVVVGLMLLAMVVYVITMDESIIPGGGGKTQQPVPAAP